MEIVYGAALLKNATPAKKREALFRYRQLPEFGNWCGALFENARHKLGKDSVFRYRQFADNEQFGNWVSSYISDKCKVSDKALFQYRQLAEFRHY